MARAALTSPASLVLWRRGGYCCINRGGSDEHDGGGLRGLPIGSCFDCNRSVRVPSAFSKLKKTQKYLPSWHRTGDPV